MVFKTLTKALKFSVVGLLIVSAGCKKDKKEKTQSDMIQAKWYTKQIMTVTTNVSTGTTLSADTNKNYSTTDFVTFDNTAKYSSSGAPLIGEYGSYTINSSNVLALVSTNNSKTTNYTITKLDASNLILESAYTNGNTKIVQDIKFSK